MRNIQSFPTLDELRTNYIVSDMVYRRAHQIVENDQCILTMHDGQDYRFSVEDRFDDFEATIKFKDSSIKHSCTCGSMADWCVHASAALLFIYRETTAKEEGLSEGGKPYTREEMTERVLKERQERAETEIFRAQFNDNIYGVHDIKTEAGILYSITIRNFDNLNGYCSCPDFKTNKLGVCKHLIYAHQQLCKKFPVKKLTGSQPYPFIEIYCDPLNDYHITHFYKGKLKGELEALLSRYFKNKQHILPQHYEKFLGFLNEAQKLKKIFVRPEVQQKIDKVLNQQVLAKLSRSIKPDFSQFKLKLFDYQKEGILFSLFKSGAIIADEMGLGKTLQAIAVAVLKKDIFNFKRTLVVCPATLKFQWLKEIERFSHERAEIVQGFRSERHRLYKESEAYFLIANYEAVMRDITLIHKYPPDMVILDEAQRIKNYTTKTSYAVKSIPKKHSLVITGTPIENRLNDLYSIMNFIDPEILAPLWEFSMNHCYFDKSKKNKITGYFNLQSLKTRLAESLIRREKKEVLSQLPALQEMKIPVQLHPKQLEMHAGFARALAPILAKKYKTIYDMQRIQQLLTCMRMVCNSTYLIDKETNISPKLDELQEILLEKLSIKENKKKVIIFSEWKTMLHLVEKILKTHRIGYAMLSGEVPVKNRGKLIEDFANNPDALVFLSTEAGGTGLNLQFADTVINLELPWNPARKNQRIGRINRLGQKSNKITAINLIACASIEERIAAGIALKESLFEAVLNEGNLTDEVDFSAKGRSTFIEQIKQLIAPFDEPQISEELTPDSEIAPESPEALIFSEQAENIESPVAAEPEPPIHVPPEIPTAPQQQPSAAQPRIVPKEIETTLNQGMQFLSGIFKMATGKELLVHPQAISVNEQTGEVTMKFQLPQM